MQSLSDPVAELARLDAMAAKRDATHGGVRVRWRRFGPAESPTVPLVLLHGGHGSWMHWARNIDALAQRHALWLPDLPGYHESDAPAPPAPGQGPLDGLLDALHGTLDALLGAGTPIALGGFSFGGFVASQLMARRGHVERLALLGSGGHDTPRPRALDMRNWKTAANRDEERAALIHNLAELMLHRGAATDPLALAIHDASCHGTRFRSRDVSLAGGLQAAIDRFTCPMLLLWGEHDVTAHARVLLPQLLAGHPNRQGAVIEGAGHWVQYERADEVNARLLAFLG